MAASTSTGHERATFPRTTPARPVPRPPTRGRRATVRARGPAERRSRGQSRGCRCSPFTPHAPPPPGLVPTDRRKIPAKSCHQTAKDASRQNPLTVTALPEHASPYGASPPSVAVSAIGFAPNRSFFYSPLCAFAALRTSPPARPPDPPAWPQAHAHALGSPRRAAAAANETLGPGRLRASLLDPP